MNKENAHKTLSDIHKILNDNNIFFWLISGTLLGFIRENDFIEYDGDIDIGIDLNTHYENNISSILKNNGFSHKQTIKNINIDNGPIEETYVKNGIGVDIFCFEELHDKIWTYAYITKPKTSWDGDLQPIKYTWDKHGYKKINIKGLDYNIPDDPVKWLKTAYGEKWNIPIKNWSYINDTLNKSIDVNQVGKLFKG